VQGVREEEKVGQRTLLDVLNAEQEQLDAEVAAVTNRHDQLIAAHSVLAAIGRLNGDTLQLGDQLYDPEVHATEVAHKWTGLSITHADGRLEASKGDWVTQTTSSPSTASLPASRAPASGSQLRRAQR
jgi:outer membrane protein